MVESVLGPATTQTSIFFWNVSQPEIEVMMPGTDRHSVDGKAVKNSKKQEDQLTISLQLKEISAKLSKLNELGKLNKDLLCKLLQEIENLK